MTCVLPDYIQLGSAIYDRRAALPNGYVLAQLRDDYAIFGSPRACAYGGCPAQVPILPDDRRDTTFTRDWQFYLMAINEGMSPATVISLMGNTKVFMNGTGIGGDVDVNNYITGNINHADDPATDKFRSMCLNTHLVHINGSLVYPLALDGSQSPPMKPDHPRPQRWEDAHMDDYLITPKTHRWFFIDCTNVKWKQDTQSLDYGPFDGGVVRSWMKDNLPHTFFPFVTTRYPGVATPASWWRVLTPEEPIPSAIRRG